VNTNEQTLTRFYTAFAALDADTMASCYAEDATFDDPAFSLKGQPEVAGMWRMLCNSTQAKGREDWRLEFRDVQADADAGTGRAHWEAHYRFSVTGRQVHNLVDAEFSFNPQGLIASHRDNFNFWRWSVQALGIPGFILGWTPWFQRQVRQQTRAKLAQFLAEKPEALLAR
jgi:ketosteroid isomerase-like protein